MARLVKPAARALLVAGLLGLTACGEDRQSLLTDAEPATVLSLQASISEPDERQLARLVAGSLADPAAREALRRAMEASRVKEKKLHLETFLRTAGEPLLASIARTRGVAPEAVFSLLSRLGNLELYLPVPEHRDRWSGGSELIVATQRDEENVPFGVDLAGRPVTLSLERPPATPALVIVPAESFAERGQPLQRDLEPRLAPAGPAGGSVAADATVWTGLWANEVHVGDLHEPWTKGSPEFEMHLDDASTRPRTRIVCTDENLSVEPYRWDMDDEDYYDPFLIATDSEVPPNAMLVLHMWEDDDTRCVLKVYNAYDYVKLVTDYLKGIADAYKGVLKKRFVNGQWVISVFNAYINGKALINGGDDFIGVAAGLQRIDTTPKTFVFKDYNAVNQGRVVLQLRAGTTE